MNASINPKKSCILVIDDDDMLNFLFCNFLESKELDTVSANSIKEAKEILQTNNSIDLILLDYQLGDGIGMDLLEENIVNRYCHKVPIIMISANEEPVFLEKCFLSGVDDYIIKPVNLSLLALKVNALIKSVGMNQLINKQKNELELFKLEAEREEQVAKFTYDYLLRQYSPPQEGIDLWLKSFSAFSGDMAVAKKTTSGSLYFMLVDATGHGLSAAISIIPVMNIFSSMAARGFHVQKIVSELNQKLLTDMPDDRFVAAVVIEINPFRREISVWNGGMPSVYWVNDGQVVYEFKSENMALGILDDDQFDSNVKTIELQDTGYLFACSDGLTEQVNSAGAPFSTERVLSIVKKSPYKLLENLASMLRAHAGTDKYCDDVAMAVIEPRQVFKHINKSFFGTGSFSFFDCQPTPFSWQVKLTGKKLEQCDIPPLCNNFLQQLGCDQYLCQKIFAIVAEMTSNAIDHGILKLSSDIKDGPEGFMRYFAERERRAKLLTDADCVILSMSWNSELAPDRLLIEVEDSGDGHNINVKSPGSDHKFSGRGIHLIETLSESVEIFLPGNKIRAIIK
ncbi:MAG: SpoIIE family protein phosphatase [Pseudomonadota bacterium]